MLHCRASHGLNVSAVALTGRLLIPLVLASRYLRYDHLQPLDGGNKDRLGIFGPLSKGSIIMLLLLTV